MPGLRNAIEVTYDIAREDRIWTGRSWMRPHTAKVQFIQSHPATVYVTGRIVRKDGTVSDTNGKVIYGRFGTPLSDGPDWVGDLVRQVMKMTEDADAQA